MVTTDAAAKSGAGAGGESDAYSARVSVREFAEALASVEARESGTRRPLLRQVLVVGEALERLGVDVDPEDLLAEVRALREENAAADGPNTAVAYNTAFAATGAENGAAVPGAKPSERRRSSRRRSVRERELQEKKQRAIMAAVAGIVVLGVVLYALFGRSKEQISVTPTAQNGPASAQAIQVHDAAGSTVYTLSDIGDNKPVRIYLADLSKVMAVEKGPALTETSDTIDDAESEWTIIKHGGKVYLRGYLNRNFSDSALRSTTIEVFNTPQSAGVENARPITLRADTPNMRAAVSADGKRLNISRIQPDAHLWDK